MRRSALTVLSVVAAGTMLAGCSSDDATDTQTGPSMTAPVEPATPPPTQTAAPQTPPPTGQTAPATGQSPPPGTASARDVDLLSHRFRVMAPDAIRIARERVGQGVVHEIEIDWDDDRSAWIWDVDTLVNGTDHEVEINADPGEVVTTEADDTDDSERAVNPERPLAVADAMATAVAARAGRVESWKLEWDDDRQEYEFEIVSGSDSDDVTVDVATGRVSDD